MPAILTNLRIREPMPAAAVALCALALQACGGGGGNNAPPPAPTASLTVNPTTINLGQTATLNWSSTNAVSCAASGGWSGNQNLTGSTVVTPTAAGNITYTLTCTGAAGGGGGPYGGGASAQSVTQNATLAVNSATPPPPTAFVMKTLVSDVAGATTLDTNLLNAWGLVFAPGDAVWIANNGNSTSTLYDGNGVIQKLVVTLPPNGNTDFQPTGIVAPDTKTFPNDFIVSTADGKSSGAASFIYSGLGGQIAGWLSPTAGAISKYIAQDKACYRGLALANNGTANFLYANDFVGAKIDVFDAKFAKQSTTAFPFTDPGLPANYAPFGIQAIANGPNGTTQIYVAYAKSGATQGSCEDTRGAGFGMISIFDANGKLVKGELVPTGGKLNAPWGMALAPKDFGTLSNLLLVSNHADGTINAYDPATGAAIASLQLASGAFTQDGLWGIAFGNDAATLNQTLNQPHNTLFFTAGPVSGMNGAYGRIDLPAQ